MENFGPYVAVRKRMDGRIRLRFEVPARQRPDGFPATTPILVRGKDALVLENLTSGDRDEIYQQAAELFAELARQRAGIVPELAKSFDQSWSSLIKLRVASSKWRRLASSTRANYGRAHVWILRRLEGDPSLLPSNIVESKIDAVLDEIEKVGVRYNTYTELRSLLKKAVAENWRPAHLNASISVELQRAEIYIWSDQDVACMVTAALQCGHPGMARLILIQREIGQRLTSVRNFRYGTHYRDGWFFHKCRKTKREVRLEVRPIVREFLDRDFAEGDFMFLNKRNGRPYTQKGAAVAFKKIVQSVPGYSDSPILLRHLRHTVVVELAKAGCTLPEIGSVTGHAMTSLHNVIEHYLPRHSVMASNATAKRDRWIDGGSGGEVIYNGTRRVFIGDLPQALIPATPAEIASGAAR